MTVKSKNFALSVSVTIVTQNKMTCWHWTVQGHLLMEDNWS